MGNLYNLLTQDVRFEEALNSCMNCGICTAVCPAAEFYNYDPRKIVDTIQRRNEDEIEALLRSETIWYCGQCLSCKTRCPRGNTPAVLIAILRSVSQKMGYFTESEKGVISENIACHNKGDDIKIGLNCRFMQEAVSKIKEDFLKIIIERPAKPILIRQLDEDEYKCIVLPLRLIG